MMIDNKKDKTEESIVKEERKEIKLIDSKSKIPGLTLWEINDVKKIYKKAEFKAQELKLDLSKNTKDYKFREKVILRDDCFYVQKLNEKSLLKFIKKYFGNGYTKETKG